VKKWLPQQLVTDRQASRAFLEYLAGIERDISAGGGGSASWGGITGTLSSQTDLQTALNAKVDTSALSESIDDRVAALLTAGTNITLTYNDAAGTLTIDASGGGGGASPIMAWVI
jgi:hypothetical protein